MAGCVVGWKEKRRVRAVSAFSTEHKDGARIIGSQPSNSLENGDVHDEDYSKVTDLCSTGCLMIMIDVPKPRSKLAHPAWRTYWLGSP